ncbi:MAG: hypothetical protein U5L76_05355 [Patescibacteria group bacterium]|nr:hypothetical protein [Patescibacteria group bacterium]
MKEYLWKNFLFLCQETRCACPVKSAFEDIITRYSEPHRRHHGVEHLYYSLLALHPVWRDLKNPLAVMAAIWFHDVIWQPLNPENEDQSIIYAWRFLEGGDVDMTFVREVMRLIRFTKHNQIPEESDIDARTIMDIDLLCLGSSWEDFQKYSQNVWNELAKKVSDKELREGRKKFFRLMLRRQDIYLTDFFRKRYKNRARSNLKRALVIL